SFLYSSFRGSILQRCISQKSNVIETAPADIRGIYEDDGSQWFQRSATSRRQTNRVDHRSWDLTKKQTHLMSSRYRNITNFCLLPKPCHYVLRSTQYPSLRFTSGNVNAVGNVRNINIEI
ncbi:hypothetical protein V1477_020555, partial [Vespula maculifrons]